MTSIPKERNVNESDTVTIITDMLEEIFGSDKYSEITREFPIQGEYCDLAIKIGEQVDFLIEVKAIDSNLNNNHLTRVLSCSSGAETKWTVLTNKQIWQLRRVPVDPKVLKSIDGYLCPNDFVEINLKKKNDVKLSFLLCRRGVIKYN